MVFISCAEMIDENVNTSLLLIVIPVF